MTPLQLSELYNLLTDKDGLSLGRIFKAMQPCIFPEERINWIIEYREKLGVEDIDLAYLRINNLIYSE